MLLLQERELNPYFKAGGSGVPDERQQAAAAAARPAAGVGDGGASWRLKALKRAQEQAEADVSGAGGCHWGEVGSMQPSRLF